MRKTNEWTNEVFHECDGELSVTATCHFVQEGNVLKASYEVEVSEDGVCATVWLDQYGNCTSNKYDCGMSEPNRNGKLVEALDDFHEKPGKDTIGSRAASAIDEYARLLGEDMQGVLVIMKRQSCTIPGVWAMRACDYSPVDDYDSDCDIIRYASLDDALKWEREIAERPVNGSNDMWRHRMAKMALRELERLR